MKSGTLLLNHYAVQQNSVFVPESGTHNYPLTLQDADVHNLVLTLCLVPVEQFSEEVVGPCQGFLYSS